MIDIIEISKYGLEKFLLFLDNRNSVDKNKVSIEVRTIIDNVKKNGDKALRDYTEKFDEVYLNDFKVTEEEINSAYERVGSEFISILNESKDNIYSYHEKQKKDGYLFLKDNGVYMGQKVTPVDSVGVYVPGGKAAYPSSVLMNVIPAKVAGVNEIVMVTPPNKNGNIDDNILAAAKIVGVNEIFKVGGAQGVAALAYGTESIKKVSVIVGPGNVYVAEAKRQVYGNVGIDMIAGPSEILIIADESGNAKFIAADLMSQAEHDEKASSILLTTSKALANEVLDEIKIQINNLSRKDIIENSLKQYGKIIICESINECIEIANLIAPEHLELLIDEPIKYLESIKNAGAIFLGKYTPEPVGDYFAGTNHVLPTCGSAKFSSPLSVDTFMKKTSYLYYSKEALLESGEKIITFAKKEGLDAHGNSIDVRLNYEES